MIIVRDIQVVRQASKRGLWEEFGTAFDMFLDAGSDREKVFFSVWKWRIGNYIVTKTKGQGELGPEPSVRDDESCTGAKLLQRAFVYGDRGTRNTCKDTTDHSEFSQRCIRMVQKSV